MPSFTAMPIFQQIFHGMKEAHAVFNNVQPPQPQGFQEFFFRLIHNS